jgi:hypothetical protein
MCSVLAIHIRLDVEQYLQALRTFMRGCYTHDVVGPFLFKQVSLQIDARVRIQERLQSRGIFTKAHIICLFRQLQHHLACIRLVFH